MTVYPISTTNLAAVANSSSHDPNKPIYMLNMWKYKQNAVYAPEHAHLSPKSCTGKEAADRYREAIQPHLPPNASIFAIFDVLTEAAAPAGEKWDWVAVVRYETLDGFRKMVESKGYRENAEPHRLAALEEWRLIMMDKLEVGAPKEE